jgi:hypothetical protein
MPTHLTLAHPWHELSRITRDGDPMPVEIMAAADTDGVGIIARWERDQNGWYLADVIDTEGGTLADVDSDDGDTVPPEPPLVPTPTALRDVLAEREKQRTKWGDAHDDEHVFGAIRIAAASLLVDGTDAHVAHPDGNHGENFDPWGLVAKHGYRGKRPDKRRALVIAIALGLAELERLDRTAGGK